jgi:hypothetical protein
MIELAGAARLRAQLLHSPSSIDPALAHHFRQGLAYTAGAALGENAPSRSDCHAAFTTPNRVGLTAGGRAWQKHAHRSGEEDKKGSSGWWGRAHGSVSTINERSLELFEKVHASSLLVGAHSHDPDVGHGQRVVEKPTLAPSPGPRLRGPCTRRVRYAVVPGSIRSRAPTPRHTGSQTRGRRFTS